MLVDDIVSNLQDLPPKVVGVAWEQPWNRGYYPQACYSEQFMSILYKHSESVPWKVFWEKEDE